MKQVKSFLKIFSLGLLLVGGAACTGNFDEINRKEYEVTKDEQGRENYNIGSTLRGLQGLVVPTKEHLYQFIEALAAGPGIMGLRSCVPINLKLITRLLTGRIRRMVIFLPNLIRFTAICRIRVMILWHWLLPNCCG